MTTAGMIRKIMVITVWVVIGGGMLTLLIAAIGKKNRELCSDYVISIKGAEHHLFVNEEDVQKILEKSAGHDLKGQPVVSFDLLTLEGMLEKNTWIRDAELYFDNRDVLHIKISEREPVARVFTTTGHSFYIDSSAKQMPLSDKLSAKVPVFTGFPNNKVLRKKDSLLLRDISNAARFIFNDPFWMAQVAQVDITSRREFEMVPVIGKHHVNLGTAMDIPAKFNRLFVFYKEVMAKTGFDAYKVIDVRYRGQVVAIKQPKISRVDSVQLRKNVEELLNRDLMKTDSVSLNNTIAADKNN